MLDLTWGPLPWTRKYRSASTEEPECNHRPVPGHGMNLLWAWSWTVAENTGRKAILTWSLGWSTYPVHFLLMVSEILSALTASQSLSSFRSCLVWATDWQRLQRWTLLLDNIYYQGHILPWIYHPWSERCSILHWQNAQILVHIGENPTTNCSATRKSAMMI